ncbi:diguanylate cyclase AdrA [Atlantibacter hermannii]|uniref:diguanylate cyclase AdrA n=1 Tax=Atlantibacter hermannii TaxID=565 RepID=UPI0028A07D2C|nr:diguanylate cyclase AdrA [Atlantibacter hermannii]
MFPKMINEQTFSKWRLWEIPEREKPMNSDDKYRSGLHFARRIWLPRTVGHFCCFIMFSGVLVAQSLSGWWWLALVFYAFVWPHLALQIAERSSDPMAAERRNLIIDTLMAGLGIAIMGGNALPCLLLFMMVNMNNIGAFGGRFFATGFMLQLITALLAVQFINAPVNVVTTPLQFYLSLPTLIIYPALFGFVCYRNACDLAEHKRQLELISTRDGMTGVYNRRHWEQLLSIEYENALRYHRASTLLLIDIDHFKQINDTYGHDVGDKAIIAVTQYLQLTLRVSDIIGRFGGDEFAVIMSGTSPESAVAAMARVHERLENLSLDDSALLNVQISVGIAPFSVHMKDYQAWLKAADLALYKAKRAGRNRTEVYDAR